MLAGHHAAITAAAGNLPGAGDDGVPVGDLVKRAAGPPGDHPRPSLLQVAAHLATAQRQALLIGPDRQGTGSGPGTGPRQRAPGTPGAAGPGLQDPLTAAWEKLASAALGLLHDLALMTVSGGRASRRQAARATVAYLGFLGSAAGRPR